MSLVMGVANRTEGEGNADTPETMSISSHKLFVMSGRTGITNVEAL